MNEALADLPPAQPASAPALLRALAANLRATLLAAAFWRFDGTVVPRPSQFVALVVLCLLLELGFQVLAAGASGSVDLQALPRALFHVPLALLAGLLVAWREREPAHLLRVAILFAGIRFWYGFPFGALDLLVATQTLGSGGEYDGRAEDAWHVIYGLWLLAMLRGVMGLSAARGAVRFAQALGAVGILAVPLWLLPAADLWRVQEPEEASDRDWFAAAREEVIYAQPALLEQNLAQVAPQRPGVTDLYFVGVAGYAAEDVFMKELGVIEGLFRARFDAERRSITLVNNPQTVARQPVASATALARTLEHLGRVMDRDDDVLFLYLTSHGSEEHRLSMEFWPLQLNDIDPQTLRQILDRSGIKWRVIAISACYSGGFIDALRDDRTLVLTASDALRQSFGCGTQSDFTYFGQAYDAALRSTWSFTEAFERARARIAEREKAESLTASDPQMFLGARIAPKLDALAERLRRSPH